MGQQQLLLIALSVIIVGAAIAVGVNMFREGSAQAEDDKFYQRAATIATEFGKWYKEPVSMGGAGGSLTSENMPSNTDAWSSILGIEDDPNDTDGLYLVSVSDGGDSYRAGDGENDAEGIVVTIRNNDDTREGIFVATSEGEALWDTGDSERPDDVTT